MAICGAWNRLVVRIAASSRSLRPGGGGAGDCNRDGLRIGSGATLHGERVSGSHLRRNLAAAKRSHDSQAIIKEGVVRIHSMPVQSGRLARLDGARVRAEFENS